MGKEQGTFPVVQLWGLTLLLPPDILSVPPVTVSEHLWGVKY